MTVRTKMLRVLAQEDINFLLTNRIPRRLATQFIGWFSRIEHPLVRDASIAVWRLFADLDLRDARQTQFKSLHDCFVRELKEGARPIDQRADILVSPCDAIVGSCGAISGTKVYQAKGFPYALVDLLTDNDLVDVYRDGCYATLRLTSAMYHRFHAPHDCRVARVIYISGDTWNVNPIALKRVERLFCKNERAVIQTSVSRSGVPTTLVAVAAILVASIRLHCLEGSLDLRERGANVIPCNSYFHKGEEMGWFEHGSTILVFVPKGFSLCEGVAEGAAIRMGEPLMRTGENA
jgi:phosphatidylserine decarboxylase